MKLNLAWVFGLMIMCCILSGYEPHFVSDPAVSPDGQQICFVYANDLWLVPFTGGSARRLTSTVAPEFGPAWSPDGSTIAFSSTRDSQTFAYTMPATGGPAEPVFQEGMTVCDWFSDNKNLLCSKSNLSWGTSLFKVPLNGQRPVLIAEIGDYFSALSPDNTKIIFNRYGEAYRESYKGSANGDLWEYDIADKTYHRLTDTEYTERYPRFSNTSTAVYFCASDGAVYQIYKAVDNDFSKKTQVTSFDIWSARDISIALDSDRITYEVFDTIWCYDPALPLQKQNYLLNIDIAEDDWTNLKREDTLIDTYNDFTVSEDESLLAFSYKYDLFVMPRKGGEVRQVTFGQAGIENLGFLPDNRTVVFSQYKDGVANLYQVKIDSLFSIKPIDWYGSGKYNVDRFYHSTDYHWVIEYTDTVGGGRIAIADKEFSNIEPIITDQVVTSGFVCSPDGTMAVYTITRDDINIRELFLYDFNTHTARKILNDDAWLYNFIWLPGQKSIFYSRSDDDKTIQRLDLVPRDELELDQDNWKDILSKNNAASITDSLSNKSKSKKQVVIKAIPPAKPLQFSQINWLQIDKRTRPIITDADYVYAVMAIDDTSFYYFKDMRGKDNKAILYKINMFGRFATEQGTFPANPDYQYIPEKTLYYKDGDKLKAFGLRGKNRADLKNEFKYGYNLHTLNEKVFEQVWGVFGRNFYDPTMHNKNWKSLYQRYKPYLKYADSPGVLEILIEEMIGDINASHTGYYPRSDQAVPYKQAAWMGLEFDRRTNLKSGIRIARIYPGSALYNVAGIRDGDILLSIDNKAISPSTSPDSLLLDKVNDKLRLVFKHNGQNVKTIVKGLSWSQNRDLWYQDKIDRRRSKTDEFSHNRIGYVMIPRMSGSEYNNFISDVFTKNADKDALIIDIRGNVGGRIHNDLLNFLSQKPNAYTTSRRFGTEKILTPGRTWTKPIALLVDENSFSDAEIFPELFKEAKLGTVIGMPTSGSVIGTWEIKLLDGSTMRMPGAGWYRLDGTNMEGNGAQPDIRVELSLNDIVADHDLQLQKAVETLLKQIKP